MMDSNFQKFEQFAKDVGIDPTTENGKHPPPGDTGHYDWEPSKEDEEYFEKARQKAREDDFARMQAEKKAQGGTVPQGGMDARPLLPMPSWIYYSNLEVDITKYLIGKGFLEPENFVVLIGASYAGKSTLTAQFSVHWAHGSSIFGIEIPRPLRIIFFQAEDSENKLISIAHLCRRLNLTPAQRELVDKNTAIVTLQGVQDAAAIAEMERHAEVFKPDIIVVNPLTSFLSKGVYDEASLNEFLRGKFPAMLRKLNCGGFAIHHPPKPAGKNQTDQTIYELQYSGAGMASITNACRGTLLLLPVDGDVFALCGGKGFYELGWKTDKVFIKRSVDEHGYWLWVPCDADQANEANEKREQRVGKQNGGGGKAKFVPYERILKIMKPEKLYSEEIMRELVKKEFDKGRDWTRDGLKEMTAQKRLIKSSQKNPKGQGFVFYRLPTVLDPAL
jgi:hypothetical protein